MTVRGGPLLVVGDALLDVDVMGRADRLAPDAPVPVVEPGTVRRRPGGAALAAVLAATDGPVVLAGCWGEDRAGAVLVGRLAEAGVTCVRLGAADTTPIRTRVRVGDSTVVRLDRAGVAAPVDPAGAERLAQLVDGAAAVLVADYGCGLAADPRVRAVLASAGGPVVWDPHPRGPDPVPGTWLATPNHVEAARGRAAAPTGSARTQLVVAAAADARRLRSAWSCRTVAVTTGPHGAVVVTGPGPALVVAAEPVAGSDTCGAGDRFAGTAARALGQGALPAEAVEAAVAAAGRFVAGGGAGSGGIRAGTASVARAGNAQRRAARASGGTVVAAGGCFDLLHSGHLAVLEQARRLGDHLVVCLNSDRSVRELKGPGRPLVPEVDRRRLLEAVRWVDEVVSFDEATPVEALRRLRPSLFVKGGDYAGGPLPEAEVLAEWGGEVVVVPYVSGRSTSRLVEELLHADR